MHPGLLFECSELQWLVGDAAGATATLQDLEAVHAADPWLDTNRMAIDGLATEIATRQTPVRARVRDLLGSLRGADSPSDRIRLLGDLVALSGQEHGDRRDYLHSRAVAIGCADDSPAVRARAIQLAEPGTDAGDSFARAALDDEAPLVRRCAAARVADFAPAAAMGLLVAAIARENDADAFRAMHEALSRLVSDPPNLAPGAEGDAATRVLVARAWGQRCSR